MKEKTQHILKALLATSVLAFALESFVFYPEYLTRIIWITLLVSVPLLIWVVKVNIRSFSSIATFLTSLLFMAASMLSMVFVSGSLYKQLFIAFLCLNFFVLVKRFVDMKVFDIQRMAYEQQYSFVDFSLLLSSFLFYTGFFGLYLHLDSFVLWHLLLSIFLSNLFLFFLFFYFNDLWFKKMWLYVFVLAFIILEVTWTLSFWPSGVLGRGVVLFFTYYLMSGLGKHYMKETFSRKVLKEYVFVGVVVLLLVLSTIKWTY